MDESVTDEQIVAILCLFGNRPGYHNNGWSGVSRYLGTTAELGAKIRAILKGE